MKSRPRSRHWLLLILLVMVLAGCQANSPDQTPASRPEGNDASLIERTATSLPISPPDITQPAIAGNPAPGTETPSPTFVPPPASFEPSAFYTLTAVLNYSTHYIAVDQQIRYQNRSSEPLPDIRLMIEPAYYPGAFQLNSITSQAGPAIGEIAWDTGQITLPLITPLMPGEILSLAISYAIQLPSPTPSAETRPIPFGYTERQTNLVDWYPFIPPYREGSGWLANKAFFFGEHLAYEAANFTVNLRISDENSFHVVAASAPAQVEGEWRRYHLEKARGFALSVSTQYQVKSAQVGNVEVTAYTFPFHPAAGEAVLDTTIKALALFNQLFGDYPRKTLSVVEADFLDGMEYDGLYFLSNGFYNLYQGTPAEYLIAIAAHETAHQWFYGLVGNDQGNEPWLDEALCTYSERLFFERYYPEALDWWWTYRVNYYQPRGAVDGSIYNPEGYRAYRDAVYLNGAVFLEELRKTVGDESFTAFLKAYVDQNRNQIATAQGFFELLAQFTEADLGQLRQRYFSSP